MVLYCQQLDTSLFEVLYQYNQRQFSLPVCQALLGIPPTLYSDLTTEQTASSLAPFYGLTSEESNLLNSSTLPVTTFLQWTGLSDQDLYSLIYQNLSPLEKTSTDAPNQYFFINNDTIPDPTPIAITEGGTLTNLSLSRFDRINRFIRLSNRLGWAYAELDWVLCTTNTQLPNDPQSLVDLDENTLNQIAKVKQLQQQTGLPADDTNGLMGSSENLWKGK